MDSQRIDSGVIRPEGAGTPWTGPCCGCPTFDGRGHDEIGELRDGEDDGKDDPQADEVLRAAEDDAPSEAIETLRATRANLRGVRSRD
jgi:hypothetical protein